MSAFPNLFQPGVIGRMRTPNRLIMPPMVLNYADARGMVTERYLAHMERIAGGGVGTMILEASFVSPEGRGFTNEIGIHHDDCIRGLARVVEAAHRHGALIGPQLYHAGRQTRSAVTGSQPVAPSSRVTRRTSKRRSSRCVFASTRPTSRPSCRIGIA